MSNTSKKEEERNEKVIRGLLKLPPNRRCINCNSLGPQYVCTNFWTFICVTCSGIHREFTHRVKSISMAKFTTFEVDALQNGGNQCAREIFLKDWDAKQTRLPDNSQVDEIRDFIRKVYVEKQYVGGRSCDKPPRDNQCRKEHEDYRRVTSFQSFFQTPPYDGQCEGQHGKTSSKLSRKPGSDHGRYVGKLSSLLYSPEHQEEHKLGNEASCWSTSVCSNSTRNDASQFSDECLKSEEAGNTSSPLKQVREILKEEALMGVCNNSPEENSERVVNMNPHPLRTAIASSNNSGTSRSNCTTSNISKSLIDLFLEPENSSDEQQLELSSSTSLYQMSGSKDANDKNLINQPMLQQPIASSVSSIDLFAVGNLSSSTIALEQKSLNDPSSENVGWATFETLDQAVSDADINLEHYSLVVPGANEYDRNNLQWPSAQNAVCDPLPFLSEQHKFTGPPNKNTAFETWNAFDDIDGNVPQASYGIEPPKLMKEVWLHNPAPYSPEEAITDGFKALFAYGFAAMNESSETALSFSSPASQPKEVSTPTLKSANPFDLPCDSYIETSNELPNMSFLEVALPNSPFPSLLYDDLPKTWVAQKSTTDYVPTLPQGGSAYGTALQIPSSHFMNISAKSTVLSIGGNPFA